jgi:hypothetical protein
VEKPEGKSPVGRPRCRLLHNIKRNFGERGWGGVDWIGLAQDRDKWSALVNVVMNLQVPQNARKFLNSCRTGELSSMQLVRATERTGNQSMSKKRKIF